MIKIKPIAIHLPQFHPFAENDEWWGKGFTEWTNVTKAKPLFKGHYQPHLPADLGFYDLRLEEARLAQEQLAKAYGIFGFCYYHYWFNGKRLLHEPLDRKLKNPKEDFPFMLCWANENWTRRWDGQDQEILIKQEYSIDDHTAHANFLCQSFFKDSRYITVDGKPVFIFYKSQLIPDLVKAIEVWRNVAKENGFKDLYLICMDNFIDEPAELLGFDAAVHFHPDFRYLKRKKIPFIQKLFNKLNIHKSILYQHFVDNYDDYFSRIKTQNNLKSSHVYPGITPMWDNTARKKVNGMILEGSTPSLYGKILKESVDSYLPKNEEESFFFINAWNEWAEGNHLEPCQKWGLDYLIETKKVFSNSK